MNALTCIVQLATCFLIISTPINASSCFPSDLEALTFFAAGLHAPLLYIPAAHDGSPPLYIPAAHDGSLTLALNESWRSDRDCCSWEGVTCTPSTTTTTTLHARVTALSLSFEDLSSVSSATILESLCNLSLLSTLHMSAEHAPSVGVQIPECLGEHLPLLQLLDLTMLNLKGPIPASFSRLLHLQHLHLSNNPSLSGPLLPLLQLPNLTSLSLFACSFSDPLPTFRTPLLQSLSLVGNHFNSTLDQFIAQSSNLTALTDLDLTVNSISGPIPSSISRLFHLQSLSLADNSLSGPLPDSLCELINLTGLDLSSNNFTGPFPPCIGHVSSLEYLDLSSNQFASPIPDEWQKLQNLVNIHLGSGNSLNGAGLPEWLFRFPKLRYLGLTSLGLQSEDVLCSTKLSMLNNTLLWLDLSSNNITGSDVLECFALHNFKQLSLYVSLDENPLSVSLRHIQLAPAIEFLSLRACNLKGFLNNKVFERRSEVFLSDNNLVGKIPTNHTANINELDLSNNYFTGFDSYGSFSQSLGSVTLSNNLIAGDVSTVLQSLGLKNCTKPAVHSSLAVLDLSYNRLVGQIPASLPVCAPNLSTLYLDNNNLSGIIPASLAECAPDLSYLYLDNNNLTGIIPKNLGKFNKPYSIRLNNNHLTGTIPASLIMTQNLILLEVSRNDLEGDLKSLFSPLRGRTPSNLIALVLAYNRISGSIPPFLGSFTPALHVIDLSHNNLTGNIPLDLHLPSFQGSDIPRSPLKEGVEIPRLVIKGAERTLDYVWENFRFLDLSGNYLEGVIPTELGDLSALMQLNLSHNSLAGRIPEALSKLLLLETLDLSFNNLQGSIPPSLSSLTKLSIFNVSYNKALEGPIPSGSQLENNESYIGDTLLCGYEVLHKTCPMVHDILTHASKNMTIKDKLATWIDEWVSIMGFSLGIVVGFFGILWLLHGPRFS